MSPHMISLFVSTHGHSSGTVRDLKLIVVIQSHVDLADHTLSVVKEDPDELRLPAVSAVMPQLQQGYHVTRDGEQVALLQFAARERVDVARLEVVARAV